VSKALSDRKDIYWRGITKYSILKMRPVQNPLNQSEHHTAVLLDTDAGQKIVLLHPMHNGSRWAGWYYKVYDAK